MDAYRFLDNDDGDRFMEQLVDEWLRGGMGIPNAQIIVAQHFDKKHLHLHSAASTRSATESSLSMSVSETLRSIGKSAALQSDIRRPGRREDQSGEIASSPTVEIRHQVDCHR